MQPHTSLLSSTVRLHNRDFSTTVPSRFNISCRPSKDVVLLCSAVSDEDRTASSSGASDNEGLIKVMFHDDQLLGRFLIVKD